MVFRLCTHLYLQNLHHSISAIRYVSIFSFLSLVFDFFLYRLLEKHLLSPFRTRPSLLFLGLRVSMVFGTVLHQIRFRSASTSTTPRVRQPVRSSSATSSTTSGDLSMRGLFDFLRDYKWVPYVFSLSLSVCDLSLSMRIFTEDITEKWIFQFFQILLETVKFEWKLPRYFASSFNISLSIINAFFTVLFSIGV